VGQFWEENPHTKVTSVTCRSARPAPTIIFSMLRSLLLSRDEVTVRVVTRGFKDLDVQLQHFSEADVALAHATKHRFDAIVVDDQLEESHLVLQKLIELPGSSKSVRIALVEATATIHTVFKTGTQVIIYKPLSAERVRQGLRAVRNLMGRDRRRSSRRVRTMIPARVSPRQARGAYKQMLLADLSDSGAAIHSEAGDLPISGTLNLEFTLPGTTELIHATAELVWRDDEGAAGVRFLDMPNYARKQLLQWLKVQPIEKVSAAAHGSI
jgi:DNA-binding NarL/FixJ family response regulator